MSLVRLLHNLGLVKGVVLKDHQGELYESIIKSNEMYPKFCHVYPFTKVGFVTLNEDGTTSGPSFYIKQWKPMR